MANSIIPIMERRSRSLKIQKPAKSDMNDVEQESQDSFLSSHYLPTMSVEGLDILHAVG